MRVVPLQVLTILLVGAAIASVWLRPVDVVRSEKIIVEQPPSLDVEDFHDEGRHIANQVQRSLDACWKGGVFRKRIHMEYAGTERILKDRFFNEWGVYFEVPPLRESAVGDWTLVLVPKRKPHNGG